MFKNKYGERNNIAGLIVKKLRQEKKWSQQELAVKLQNVNHDIGKNGVQEMESGERFITDIELVSLAKVFSVSVETLLNVETVEYTKDESSVGVKQVADNRK